MREALRGALLSVLFFGGLALLSVPAVAQGGGPSGPCEEGEHTDNGSHICNEDGEWVPVDGTVDVTAPPPDNPLPSPTETDPPETPPETDPNPCLTCHKPHTTTPPPKPKKDCSAQVKALNAADEMVERRCKWYASFSERCLDAEAAYEMALKDLARCQGPTIRPGFR